MEKRVEFSLVFSINVDGSISPVKNIKIGGVQIGTGIKIGRGVSFGGIDLSMYIGRDLLVEEQGETFVIKGIF